MPHRRQQCSAYKRFLVFLSGNLSSVFLRLQKILNVFKFRSSVSSLSLSIAQKLTPQTLEGQACYLQCSQNVARPSRNADRRGPDKPQTNDTTKRISALRRQSVRFVLLSEPQPVLHRKDCRSNSKCQCRFFPGRCRKLLAMRRVHS